MVLKILASIICLFSLQVKASSTVCSNEFLYYSYISENFVSEPPSGTVVGKLALVFRAAVLVNETFFSGQSQIQTPAFSMELIGPVEGLEKTGNQITGTRLFKQVAILHKTSKVRPEDSKEIFRGMVICFTKFDRR